MRGWFDRHWVFFPFYAVIALYLIRLALGQGPIPLTPRVFWLFFVIAVIWYPIFRTRRVHTLLSGWSAECGFEIIRSRWAGYRLRPFPLAWFGNQTVYWLLVRDRDGQEHTCWLKLGAFFTGLLSDNVEVRWETTDRFGGG